MIYLRVLRAVSRSMDSVGSRMPVGKQSPPVREAISVTSIVRMAALIALCLPLWGLGNFSERPNSSA